MMLLRAQVLMLLAGSAMSLNHGNFIGGGDFDAKTATPEILENYLEFFNRLPPGYKPTTDEPSAAPFSVGPTGTPSVEPSIAPVPTKAPIPAGRFPSPVAPSPAPTRPWQLKKTPPPHLRPPVVTRTASYTAEWGSDAKGCQQVVPNVFFNCHEGGVIQLNGFGNAMCAVVADDRIACTQDDLDMDASIGFSCSGIRQPHLMATGTVGPNNARDCQVNGNIVKYLTLSRECDDSIVDTEETCNGGVPYEQGDTFYCASPAICGNGNSCEELKLEPLAMSNTNTDLSCSHVSPIEDLKDWEFPESHLSSVTVIDWRISGEMRGCKWRSPSILIKCEHGGALSLEEDYPFCNMLPENIAECHSFAPFSTESEEAMDLMVKCSGKSESQLVLTVEIYSQDVEALCDPEGTIIQSVMLSRGCGEVGSEDFFSVNHPSFCDAEDQVFAVDDYHSHCFVGNTCLNDHGCHTMSIPLLTADTGSGPHVPCTYVE